MPNNSSPPTHGSPGFSLAFNRSPGPASHEASFVGRLLRFFLLFLFWMSGQPNPNTLCTTHGLVQPQREKTMKGKRPPKARRNPSAGQGLPSELRHSEGALRPFGSGRNSQGGGLCTMARCSPDLSRPDAAQLSLRAFREPLPGCRRPGGSEGFGITHQTNPRNPRE